MHVDVFAMFCLKSTMHNCAFKHASVKKMNTKIDTANNYEQNETVQPNIQRDKHIYKTMFEQLEFYINIRQEM